MSSPEPKDNRKTVPVQPDIARIAEAEEKEGIVDQQSAVAAARGKRAESPEQANQGASTMAPAEGADDLPPPDPGSPSQ